MGDIVFAVNPMPATDEYVYPLAKNFEDFLSLIITCNSTAAVEQIIGWDNREIFENYIQPTEDEYYLRCKEIFDYIKDALNIKLMDDSFEYVKNLQEDFPYEKISFSDEY